MVNYGLMVVEGMQLYLDFQRNMAKMTEEEKAEAWSRMRSGLTRANEMWESAGEPG